jgi:hypothetical protein
VQINLLEGATVNQTFKVRENVPIFTFPNSINLDESASYNHVIETV